MTYNLFLDDERFPLDVKWINLPVVMWEIVRSFEQFKDIIESKGVPAYITFDHDLADEHYVAMLKDYQINNTGEKLFVVSETLQDVDYGREKTGYDCAKWLVEYCADNGVNFPEYSVHSMNPIGAKRIHDYVANAKRHLKI